MAAARNQLAALIGKGPDRGIDIALPANPKIRPFGVPTHLAADLIGRRPDVVAARWWLDRQYVALGCVPKRASGKVMSSEKALAVAESSGLARFQDEEFRAVFGWAVHSGQLDDLEHEGERILVDEDQGRPPPPGEQSFTNH